MLTGCLFPSNGSPIAAIPSSRPNRDGGPGPPSHLRGEENRGLRRSARILPQCDEPGCRLIHRRRSAGELRSSLAVGTLTHCEDAGSRNGIRVSSFYASDVVLGNHPCIEPQSGGATLALPEQQQLKSTAYNDMIQLSMKPPPLTAARVVRATMTEILTRCFSAITPFLRT